MEVNLEKLDKIVQKGQQLQELLEKNPQLLEFMRLVNATEGKAVLAPVKADKLIEAKEVASILKIPIGRVGEYVKAGYLTAYTTPPTTNRKYWISQVLAIPKAV